MGILVHVPFVLPDALSGPQVPQLDLWEEAQRLSGRVQQVLVSPGHESQRGRGGLHRPPQVRKYKSPHSKSENPSEAPGPVPHPFRSDEALSRRQSSCPAHLAPHLASTCLSPASVRHESLLPSPSPGPEQLLRLESQRYPYRSGHVGRHQALLFLEDLHGGHCRVVEQAGGLPALALILTTQINGKDFARTTAVKQQRSLWREGLLGTSIQGCES